MPASFNTLHGGGVADTRTHVYSVYVVHGFYSQTSDTQNHKTYRALDIK